jgi:hypothetical protein
LTHGKPHVLRDIIFEWEDGSIGRHDVEWMDLERHKACFCLIVCFESKDVAMGNIDFQTHEDCCNWVVIQRLVHENTCFDT